MELWKFCQEIRYKENAKNIYQALFFPKILEKDNGSQRSRERRIEQSLLQQQRDWQDIDGTYKKIYKLTFSICFIKIHLLKKCCFNHQCSIGKVNNKHRSGSDLERFSKL